MKSLIGFPKKVKYLTFGDSERSRSVTEISGAEYLANGARREFASTEGPYKVPYRIPQKGETFDFQ